MDSTELSKALAKLSDEGSITITSKVSTRDGEVIDGQIFDPAPEINDVIKFHIERDSKRGAMNLFIGGQEFGVMKDSEDNFMDCAKGIIKSELSSSAISPDKKQKVFIETIDAQIKKQERNCNKPAHPAPSADFVERSKGMDPLK